MQHIKVKLAAALLFLVAALPASARVELRALVEKEVRVTRPDGEQVVQRVPAEKVIPGETVVYSIVARNTGVEPAADVVITDPIPEHVLYQAGSAEGTGARVEFSVDLGATWGAPDALTVPGEAGPRAATPADYTHIRWVFQTPLAAGEQRGVSFRARLR